MSPRPARRVLSPELERVNTLWAKITTVVVVSTLVIILLTYRLITTAMPYPPPSFQSVIDINAYYISVILASGSPYRKVDAPAFAGAVGTFGLRPQPAEGETWERMTRQFRAALKQQDVSAPVIVSWSPENPWPIASVAVKDQGWLVIPIFIPPPVVDLLPFIIAGIFLIIVGLSVVAIGVIHRLMRPLALIKRSLASVNINGELPSVPERGPADIRVTARAINLLSRRLKDAVESRMRLVAAAGHDFRTPMTRMRLRAEMLPEGDREKWVNDLDELGHIADSAIGLVREEIANGGGERVRLDRLVGDVIDELRELQLDVHAMDTEPVEVRGKPMSMKRAIRNLLVNAATHGGGAHVSIRNESGAVRVEIVDNGPGIPRELLSRAFEPFFRVEQARPARPGVGLGLAIAREIIQHNRGTLRLANRASGGLIQTIELPAVVTENAA